MLSARCDRFFQGRMLLTTSLGWHFSHGPYFLLPYLELLYFYTDQRALPLMTVRICQRMLCWWLCGQSFLRRCELILWHCKSFMFKTFYWSYLRKLFLQYQFLSNPFFDVTILPQHTPRQRKREWLPRRLGSF